MYRRVIFAASIAAYGAFLVEVMVLKVVPLIKIGGVMLNFGGTQDGQPNFVPFKTIGPYLLGYKGLIIAGINLAGNILLLVPLGFLMPLVFPGMTAKKAFALATAACLAIEVLQVVMRVGIFDIDDVILNVLGCMAGYGAFVILARVLRPMRPAHALAAILAAGALVAGAAAYGVVAYHVSFAPGVGSGQPERLGSAGGGDLCGGTGGNEIIDTGQNVITVRRGDGGNLSVIVSDQTTVETLAGPAAVSDLKPGERVTLVGGMNPDGTFSADTLVVCGAPN
jgi:glycopeptide antibiotics resistance protein